MLPTHTPHVSVLSALATTASPSAVSCCAVKALQLATVGRVQLQLVCADNRVCVSDFSSFVQANTAANSGSVHPMLPFMPHLFQG
jgi:hypothetical protein